MVDGELGILRGKEGKATLPGAPVLGRPGGLCVGAAVAAFADWLLEWTAHGGRWGRRGWERGRRILPAGGSLLIVCQIFISGQRVLFKVFLQ